MEQHQNSNYKLQITNYKSEISFGITAVGGRSNTNRGVLTINY